MAKSVFTAVDPQGVEHKRTSENRVYTHTVVVKYGQAYAARKLVAARQHVIQQAPEDYAFHQSMADGTWYTVQHPQFIDQKNDAEAARHADEIAGLTVEGYIAKRLKEVEAEHVTKLESGEYDRYWNAGWCSRHDLAQKLAGGNFHHTPENRAFIEDVQILPATKVK